MTATWQDRYPDELAPNPEIDEPFECHDFRDHGDPMEKRDIGAASDWEHNQQRERTPGLGWR